MTLSEAISALQKAFSETVHPELIILQFSTRSQEEAFRNWMGTKVDAEYIEIVSMKDPYIIRACGQKVQLRSRINT